MNFLSIFFIISLALSTSSVGAMENNDHNKREEHGEEEGPNKRPKKDQNQLNEDLIWAIEYGIQHNKTEWLKRVLAEGADPNCQTKNGYSVLFKALAQYIHHQQKSSSGLDVLNILIDAGARIDDQFRDSNTVLIDAASFGMISCIKLFIEKGADLNIQNKDGDTALMSAVREKKIECVRILVGKGADLTQKNLKGINVLDLALALNCGDKDQATVDCIRILIEGGARFDFIKNPLIAALGEGASLAMIVLLLEKKVVDFNACNESGFTALMNAASYSREEHVELILKYEVDLCIQNNQGVNALMFAVLEGNKNCVKMILEAALKRDQALFEKNAIKCFENLPEGPVKEKLRQNIMLLLLCKKRKAWLPAKFIMLEIAKLSVQNPFNILSAILNVRNTANNKTALEMAEENEEIKNLLLEYQELLPQEDERPNNDN